MDRRTVIVHSDPDAETSIEVVLRPATISDGLHKHKLQALGVLTTAQGSAVREAATILHPICVACVDSPQWVRELKFQDFQNLLEVEVESWYQAALELNPHWDPEQVVDIGDPKAIDKKWSVEDWLRAAYDNPDTDGGAMPSFEEKVFMFGSMSDELLERAKKILTILELTEFNWTIKDILEQPEAEIDAVFYLKSIGERMRTQGRKRRENKTGA